MYIKKHCLQQQYEQNEKLCANYRILSHIHQYKNKKYEEKKNLHTDRSKSRDSNREKIEDNTKNTK